MNYLSKKFVENSPQNFFSHQLSESRNGHFQSQGKETPQKVKFFEDSPALEKYNSLQSEEQQMKNSDPNQGH